MKEFFISSDSDTCYYFRQLIIKTEKENIFYKTEEKRDVLRERGVGLPAQLFPLACLGVILHADVVGVEFMARDVCEQLREVQPPQELHRVRVAAVTHAA